MNTKKMPPLLGKTLNQVYDLDTYIFIKYHVLIFI